jgi:putative pyruvate formate lyase activating enzyme
MLHAFEEAELSPSHQVYFAGCNLRCEFCTVSEWNERPLGADELDIEWVAKRIEQRRREGARNVNLLGGEPTVSLPGILRLIGLIPRETQVVLNSNMYYNVCVDMLLRGFVDIYLADLKCGSSACARALLDAGDYVDVARRNIVTVREHARLIVRHVVLPGHTECCLRPTLWWLAAEVPGVKLSLRTNYVPPAEAVSAPGGYLTNREALDAVRYAQELGLNLVE